VGKLTGAFDFLLDVAACQCGTAIDLNRQGGSGEPPPTIGQ
jgi:hypothetical protein